MGYLLRICISVFLIETIIVPFLNGYIPKSKTRVSNYVDANDDDDILPNFRCPSKCTCETTISGQNLRLRNSINRLNFNNINNGEDDDYVDTLKTLSVYCHRGGLNNTDFFKILQQISNVAAVTVLEVRAPFESPNFFQWNDNLNRLTKLKKLALVNCGIPALSRSVRMPSLKHLDLSYNKIDEIQLGSFIGLPLLETLDVSHNRIKTMPTGAFMYSRQLKRLSLSHNSLSELSASMLRGPEKLIELELDGNGKDGRLKPQQINELFMDVGGALERLEINSCGLKNSEIEKLQFSRVPKIRRLGLANNSLTDVPSVAIRALENLQILDLSNNLIKNLEPCSFCACNITKVLLSHNLLGLNVKLVDDEKVPISVKSIHREAFADTHINELDLSNNFFSIFDSRWLHDAQKSLKILHLSGNKINEFHNELIHTLPQLTHLHMAENSIQEVPYSLPKYYAQLKFLNLSKNLLQELPSNTRFLLPSMRTLDLSHNRFNSLSPIVMTSFVEELDQLYIHHNPWDCECAVQNLQHYMLQRLSYKRKLNYEATQCDRPKLLRGQPLYRVQKINDCAVLFGATYGFTQISELLLLLSGLLIAAFVVFVLVILLLHCGREHKRKAVYVTNEHSQIQLTHPLDTPNENVNGNLPTIIHENTYSTSTQLLNNGIHKFNKMSVHSEKNGSAMNGLIRQKRNYRTSEPPPAGSMFVTF